jgi:hypothetical protein
MNNKILNLVGSIDKFQTLIRKNAVAPAAAGAAASTTQIAILIALIPIVSRGIDKFFNTTKLPDDAKRIQENLLDYKEDYQDEDWFKPFANEYNSFLDKLNILIKGNEEIINLLALPKGEETNEKIAIEIQKFLTALGEAERLAPGVNAFLEENKNSATKALDFVGETFGALGIKTDSMAAQAGIMSFYQHSQYERLKLEQILIDATKEKKSTPSQGRKFDLNQPLIEEEKQKGSERNPPAQISSVEDFANIFNVEAE